jgi:hypothetical protein
LTSERHLLVENFFFASPTAMTGCWDPYAIGWLRNRLLGCADRDWEPPGRRFYIRRLGANRGIANEDDVVEFFRQRGWAILVLETLTVRQKIRLFTEAEAVCGLHGAGFMNLLWSKPGCRVLEIFAHTYLNGVFEGIAECLKLRHRYLIGAGDGARVARVDMAELRKQVDAMEGGS